MWSIINICFRSNVKTWYWVLILFKYFMMQLPIVWDLISFNVLPVIIGCNYIIWYINIPSDQTSSDAFCSWPFKRPGDHILSTAGYYYDSADSLIAKFSGSAIKYVKDPSSLSSINTFDGLRFWWNIPFLCSAYNPFDNCNMHSLILKGENVVQCYLLISISL